MKGAETFYLPLVQVCPLEAPGDINLFVTDDSYTVLVGEIVHFQFTQGHVSGRGHHTPFISVLTFIIYCSFITLLSSPHIFLSFYFLPSFFLPLSPNPPSPLPLLSPPPPSYLPRVQSSQQSTDGPTGTIPLPISLD